MFPPVLRAQRRGISCSRYFINNQLLRCRFLTDSAASAPAQGKYCHGTGYFQISGLSRRSTRTSENARAQRRPMYVAQIVSFSARWRHPLQVALLTSPDEPSCRSPCSTPWRESDGPQPRWRPPEMHIHHRRPMISLPDRAAEHRQHRRSSWSPLLTFRRREVGFYLYSHHLHQSLSFGPLRMSAKTKPY